MIFSPSTTPQQKWRKLSHRVNCVIKLNDKKIPENDALSVLIGAKNSAENSAYISYDNTFLLNDNGRLIVSGIIENPQEILDFAQFQGCDKLLISTDNFDIFQNEVIEHGEIFEKRGTRKDTLNKNPFPDYKSVYHKMSEHFDLPDYNDFLVSLHRNKSHTALIEQENSVAIIEFFEKSAYLNAICTEKETQRQGCASKILSYISNCFDRIFLFKEFSKNDEFYHKNGFTKCSEFKILKVEI